MSLKSRKTALALLIALSWGAAIAAIANDTEATASTAAPEACERVCPLPQRARHEAAPAPGPSYRELAYIAYNRGVIEESRNDRYAAIRHFTAAYRLLPGHPAIAAKARELGL